VEATRTWSGAPEGILLAWGMVMLQIWVNIYFGIFSGSETRILMHGRRPSIAGGRRPRIAVVDITKNPYLCTRYAYRNFEKQDPQGSGYGG